MDDQKRPSITDPIENLASRVKALEDKSHGWMANAKNFGVIIGCVGGLLGGISTLRELWVQVTAKPDFVVTTNRNLELTWSADDRSLSFTRSMAFTNKGEMVGSIPDLPKAYLESDSLAASAELSEIQAEDERDVAKFPVTVKASEGKTLTFHMASNFSGVSERTFPKEGTYKLNITLEAPLVQDVYCFRLTRLSIAELQEKGQAKFFASEACSP